MTTVPHIKYIMKGELPTPPYQFVFWTVWDTPDCDNLYSGYANLINIVVDYSITDDVTSGGEPGDESDCCSGGGTGTFTAGCDLAGTDTCQTVVALQGSTLSPPLSGNSSHKTLHGDSGGTLNWSLVDLGTDVTGTLGIGNLPSLAGDVSGVITANTVDKLKGKNLDTALASISSTQDGYVLTWINGSSKWQAKPIGTGITAPTGTGFAHITSSAFDPTATANVRYASGKLQTDTNIQWKNSSITGDLAWTPASTSKTLTLPNATDTIVARATVDTLTNKTLDSPVCIGTPVYQGTRFSIKSIIGEVQTSSTSATTVASYTMSNETHCLFDVIVTYARRTNVTKAAAYKRSVSYRRTSAGVATIVGALESGTDEETTSGDDVTIDTDGGSTVRVRVTAADSDNRNWSCEIRLQETLAT